MVNAIETKSIIGLRDGRIFYVPAYQRGYRWNKEQVKEITANNELAIILDEVVQEMKGHGRVVIHPSGTEPKIRVWVCGDDENLVKSCGQKLWDKIENLAKSA